MNTEFVWVNKTEQLLSLPEVLKNHYTQQKVKVFHNGNQLWMPSGERALKFGELAGSSENETRFLGLRIMMVRKSTSVKC